MTIIICTRGRPDELARTLASLSQVSVPPEFRAELLIVENGIKGNAAELASSFHHDGITVRYVLEVVSGKSNALNRAVVESTGTILLFSDDDIRFPTNWIARMCEAIQCGRADAVAGGVVLSPDLLRPWMNHTHRAWLASTADYLSAESPSEMCGANMAVSRHVFEKIGGFDPELGPGITGGGEESLLSWQIKQAGFKIESALSVHVEHHLKPERLQYQNWLKAARLKGKTRAYLLHHWYHQEIHHPFARSLFLKTKLALRRGLSLRRQPESEGIAPWELSYVENIAQYEQYLNERRRPRNYELRGLRRLHPSQKTVA